MATTSVLQVLVTTLVTAGAIALISRVLRKAKPSVAGDMTGAIEPEKGIAWFTVIAGCVMAVAGLYDTCFEEPAQAGVC